MSLLKRESAKADKQLTRLEYESTGDIHVSAIAGRLDTLIGAN